MNNLTNYNRILWQCRRGMLELDEILLNFFYKNYNKLSCSMQQSFSKLLEFSDHELCDYFLAKKNPDTKELQDLIFLINNIK